jgi:protein translocase SecG subunit
MCRDADKTSNKGVSVGFLSFLHIIIAVLLITAILMQAGRGGGLAEGFSSAESLLGPQTNKFMVKVTAVMAALFLGLAIVLAVLNARKEHSLMTDLPDARHKINAAAPAPTGNTEGK